MTKKLFPILIGALLIISCGQNKVKENKGSNDGEKIVFNDVVLDTLINHVDSYIDKNVAFEGTVEHVCKHGGKKLFIFGNNPEDGIKVTSGENYSQFEVEMEGSTIKVEGVVKEERIDEKYLAEWEEKISSNVNKVNEENEEKEVEEGNHHGEGMGEHHEASNEDLEKINKLRKQIESSDKGYISNYSIECIKYDELSKNMQDTTEVKEAE